MIEYQPRHALQVLTSDAKNRAWRTLYQQLAIDVLMSVVLVLYPVIRDAQSWDDFDWRVLAFLVVKTGLATAAAYLMRRYLDRTTFPTPLPPEYPGQPADQD